MTHREASKRFLRAFCAGDLERLRTLLAEDLVFEGPLFCFTSRAAYLESLSADGSVELVDHELLRITAEGSDVALLYRLRKPGGTLLVSQWNRFRDGKIAEITLTFDARGFDDR